MERNTEIIVNIVLGRKIDINWDEIDFEKLLVLASHNRVLYVFAKKLLNSEIDFPERHRDILKDIQKEGEKNLVALRNTLLLLENVFKKENIDYLIVKTFKYLDYVTFDVDFLVRYEEFEKAINVLKKNDIVIKPHPNLRTQGQHQRNCFKSGYLKMDLHRKFFWLGIDHIDLNFVWDNTTERKIGGVTCPTPSLEVDFLLHNKQLVYERRYITLLDFLAVKYANDEGLNWDSIINQVFKYKWDDTFFILMNWLNYLHREIFRKDMVDLNKYFNKKEYKIKERELKLPFNYPIEDVMKVFKEIVFKQKRIPFLEFVYYFFTKCRYIISNRLPFYDHWYDFNKINKHRYKVANCIN